MTPLMPTVRRVLCVAALLTLAACAQPSAPAAAPTFELDAQSEGGTYSVAAGPAAVSMGDYTKLSTMVTLDEVSYRADKLGAPLRDVGSVIVTIKAADYTLTQTVNPPFQSAGRYAEVGLPVPNGALSVSAQAIARNGKSLAYKTVSMPAAGRKAFVTMSLALKYPPTPAPVASKPPAALQPCAK